MRCPYQRCQLRVWLPCYHRRQMTNSIQGMYPALFYKSVLDSKHEPTLTQPACCLFHVEVVLADVQFHSEICLLIIGSRDWRSCFVKVTEFWKTTQLKIRVNSFVDLARICMLVVTSSAANNVACAFVRDTVWKRVLTLDCSHNFILSMANLVRTSTFKIINDRSSTKFDLIHRLLEKYCMLD